MLQRWNRHLGRPACLQERQLLPSLLQAATSGPGPVQRPAAEAVGNLCADPQMAVEALEGHGGLGLLVSLALSQDPEVQVGTGSAT